MPNFRKGAEAAVKAATQSGVGKFVPNIRWEENETKYVQFLWPFEDIPTVLMHTFIKVDQRDDGSDVLENFISRKDPGLDGPQGYDPLVDRFGETPVNRTIGLAVALEPVFASGSKKKIQSFDLGIRQYETKDGDIKEVPAVGLIIQSPRTFYSRLAEVAGMADDNIAEHVYAVKRTGASKDTQYNFARVADAVDLSGDEDLEAFLEEFDFDAYLDELSSEERMHELIDDLPDDWVVNKFSKKKKNAGGRSSSGTSRTKRKAEPVAEEGVEADDEPSDEPTAEPAAPVKTRRFAQLKAELAAKK